MSDHDFTPEPGEVWIVTDRKIVDPDTGDLLYYISLEANKPFIITYISASHIGYVMAGSDPEPEQGKLLIGDFPWLEHCVRIFPTVPSWDEILEDDLKDTLKNSQADVQSAIGFVRIGERDDDILHYLYSSLGHQHRLLKKMGIDMNFVNYRPEAYHKAYGGNDASH